MNDLARARYDEEPKKPFGGKNKRLGFLLVACKKRIKNANNIKARPLGNLKMLKYMAG
jgi:hypothetical protein